MLKRSCFSLLWLLVIATLAVITAWAATKVSPFQFPLMLPTAWLVGVILIAVDRPRMYENWRQRWRSRFVWCVVAYAILLGLGPMIAIDGYLEYWPWFIVLLFPLLVVGVSEPARGHWRCGIGALLVLYGQFFAMIYNLTHYQSGVGCWFGWIS
jgi:hypothetical protein